MQRIPADTPATDELVQVLDILKAFRIGSLSLEDMTENKANEDSDDPYAKASPDPITPHNFLLRTHHALSMVLCVPIR